MSSPKVLILNQPFDNISGGGITLSNLFTGWQRKNLAVACSGYLLTASTNPEICDNYYQLGSKERKWIFPFNLFNRKYYSGAITLTNSSKENVVIKKSKLRDRIIHDFMLPVFDYFGLSHFAAKVDLSPEFCKWVDEFDPLVIYAQATTREELLFCLRVSEYFEKPMVFHMMDDWPKTIGVKRFMSRYWEKKINAELKMLLDQAHVALSISDYMAEEYERRYGKKMTTFHNPIHLDFWKKAQRKDYRFKDNPSILYAGRVGLGIEKSLKNIAKAIEKVNSDIGVNLKFALQVKDEPIWAKEFSCVQHSSFVPYEELPRVFAESDFLILPYDFSDESLNFIRYSMPTKAPEYMVSGTPIIIFSPEDTALVKYVKKFDCAEVVTENNIIVLANTIAKLVKDETRRKKIAQNAIHIAEKNHNSIAVRAHFEEVIKSAIHR